MIKGGQRAEVRIEIEEMVCIEKYEDFKHFGQFVITYKDEGNKKSCLTLKSLVMFSSLGHIPKHFTFSVLGRGQVTELINPK